MEVQKTFLNASESAKFLGIHRPKFYKILATGALPAVMQTGRIKLYRLSDLKRLQKKLEKSK